MVVESDDTLFIYSRNIAGVVRCVANISTTAIAGNILHYIGVSRGKLICFLHGHRRGLHFRGHLIHWHHVQCSSLLGRARWQASERYNADEQDEKKFAGNFYLGLHIRLSS